MGGGGGGFASSKSAAFSFIGHSGSQTRFCTRHPRVLGAKHSSNHDYWCYLVTGGAMLQ